MENAVNGLIIAITNSMSTWATAFGNGIVKIFINVFLSVDSNGTITGLNLLGYTAVIFIGLGIVLLLVCIFIYKAAETYKIRALGTIPAGIRGELDVEFEELLHKEQLDMWRELVFEENRENRKNWKKTNAVNSSIASEDLWD